MIFKRKSKDLKKAENAGYVKQHIEKLEEVEVKETDSNIEEISYVRATFWKRCSIILFDLICCFLLTIGCFIGIRKIVYSTGSMDKANKYLHHEQIDSGLYVKSKTKENYSDIIDYLEASDGDISVELNFVELQVERYFTYVEKKIGPEEAKAVYDQFNEYKLHKKMKKDGVPIFIVDENTNEIVINPNPKIKYGDVINIFYKPYVKEIAIGHFIAKIPHIYEIQRYMANMLFFVQIPVSLLIGFSVIYYFIPLCFWRNKQTLGRLVFKTGLTDKNVLTVKFGRFTARFAIMFFGEVILSIFTLGIPLFVSFSLMAFSKKKQNFHDYMLGIEEVDLTNAKIYKNMDELVAPQSNYDLENFKPLSK